MLVHALALAVLGVAAGALAAAAATALELKLHGSGPHGYGNLAYAVLYGMLLVPAGLATGLVVAFALPAAGLDHAAAVVAGACAAEGALAFVALNFLTGKNAP